MQIFSATREQHQEMQVELEATRCRARVMLMNQGQELQETHVMAVQLHEKVEWLVNILSAQLKDHDKVRLVSH